MLIIYTWAQKILSMESTGNLALAPTMQVGIIRNSHHSSPSWKLPDISHIYGQERCQEHH